MRKKTLADRPERHEVTQYVIVDVLPYRVNEDRPGVTRLPTRRVLHLEFWAQSSIYLFPFLFLAFVFRCLALADPARPGAAGPWPAGGGTGYRRLKTSTTTANPDTAGSQNVSEMPVR